ncbi:MAG: ATP-binding protein [Syntrophobacteraceae bacterium]|jgi:signal transduction histidine kinase|nr:ATP-binding protein [Syntrophobacteraceae bacterium]
MVRRTSWPERDLPFWLDYLPAAVMVMGSVVLWITGPRLVGGVALLAACGGMFSVRRLQSEIRRASEQRCFLDQQLIQSQKLASIGELSSGIAHEINNPLAIIGQEVEWIRHVVAESAGSMGPAESELKDSLQEIARQVERCGEITHKLLDFARKKEPLIQSVDINRLVEDMARLVEREATLHNIRLERAYAHDLPVTKTDAPLVRQVVLNILNNATHAIGKDGTITIRTRARENAGIEILVSDTGCGVPPEHLDKIFDPFFTTKAPGKGTGLGLSICHGIMERLGGGISLESKVGQGTTFTIQLPSAND